ncbi:MAG: hypothetical protein HEQ39_04920 [Rhizobacter sp.]
MNTRNLPYLKVLVLSTTLALGACGGGGSDETSTVDPAITPTTPTTPTTNTPPSTTGAPTAQVDPVAESIVSFAVDSRLKLTALGSVYLEVFPVALFKNGGALSDTTGLIYPAGLDAHRSKFPALWSQWRQSGADVQVLQSNGSWKTITAANIMPKAVGNTRLAGVYESLSVSSTASFGLSIIASDKYTFTNVGAVARGGYNVGNSANVSAFTTTPNNRGTYTINGHMLRITYEDGSKEERVVVADPNKPKYIFIDGVMYSLN